MMTGHFIDEPSTRESDAGIECTITVIPGKADETFVATIGINCRGPTLNKRFAAFATMFLFCSHVN